MADSLKELMKIYMYTLAKSFSLEIEASCLVTRGHIPALLLGQIPLPTYPQCFAHHIRTQVQLCARVSSPGIHLLKLLAQALRCQILFVYTFVWSAHINMWVWDLETAVLTNATCVERGKVQLDVHEQVEKNPRLSVVLRN